MLIAGLQWDALQGVAWVRMIFTYSAEAGLPEAVAMTFDGEHPCPMCRMIEQERTATTNSTPDTICAGKDEPPLVMASGSAALQVSRQLPTIGTFALSVFHPWERRESPPVPPPRHDACPV